MGLGELMCGDAAIVVLFQGLEADGAENLFRGGETGEEP